jgi:hypothetical protein
VLLHDARREVLDHHIRLSDQIPADRLGFRGGEVHRHVLLADVVLDEIGAAAFPVHRQQARQFTAQGFDLDHFGTVVRERLACERAGQDAGDIDDADALEHGCCHGLLQRVLSN